MTARPRPISMLLVGSAFVLGSAFCSSGSSPRTGPSSAGVAAAAATTSASAPLPTASASASASGAQARREFRAEEFNETEHSRDPFRSYVRAFTEQAKTRVRSERKVLINRFTIDELRLVALVTRTDVPRAMLIDPTGHGWVVTKGEFLGKAELVHGAGPGGVDYELNWRVDRIREGDVVLIREDPGHADVPAATRVIALHTENPEAVSTP